MIPSRLLSPLSFVYGAGVRLRNAMYDSGLLKSSRAEVPVISVGNLMAGGSGKSPVTIDIAQRLLGEGPVQRFAVVSRGYRRRLRGAQIVSDGLGVHLEPELGGDEPVMIARKLNGVPVIVAEKRIEGIAIAVQRFKSKLILLDDAFQHRALYRDLDIVLLDETAPAWNWRLLPAGRMRETGEALKRAGLVALTGGGDLRQRESLRRWVGRYTDADLLEGSLVPHCLRNLKSCETVPPERLAGLRVAAVCGIARPRRFHRTLESLGAVTVMKRILPDHAGYDSRLINELIGGAWSARADALIVTEKDAVKWKPGDTTPSVFALEMKWRWTNGEARLREILHRFVETVGM